LFVRQIHECIHSNRSQPTLCSQQTEGPPQHNASHRKRGAEQLSLPPTLHQPLTQAALHTALLQRRPAAGQVGAAGVWRLKVPALSCFSAGCAGSAPTHRRDVIHDAVLLIHPPPESLIHQLQVSSNSNSRASAKPSVTAGEDAADVHTLWEAEAGACARPMQVGRGCSRPNVEAELFAPVTQGKTLKCVMVLQFRDLSKTQDDLTHLARSPGTTNSCQLLSGTVAQHMPLPYKHYSAAWKVKDQPAVTPFLHAYRPGSPQCCHSPTLQPVLWRPALAHPAQPPPGC